MMSVKIEIVTRDRRGLWDFRSVGNDVKHRACKNEPFELAQGGVEGGLAFGEELGAGGTRADGHWGHLLHVAPGGEAGRLGVEAQYADDLHLDVRPQDLGVALVPADGLHNPVDCGAGNKDRLVSTRLRVK